MLVTLGLILSVIFTYYFLAEITRFFFSVFLVYMIVTTLYFLYIMAYPFIAKEKEASKGTFRAFFEKVRSWSFFKKERQKVRVEPLT